MSLRGIVAVWGTRCPHVAPGTVKSLLYRATRKLRDELAFYRDEL